MVVEILKWLTVIGLLFDIFGVTVFAWDLFISKDEAHKRSLALTWSSDLNPMGKALIAQSRKAKLGLVLLVFGFVLQLVGSIAGLLGQ